MASVDMKSGDVVEIHATPEYEAYSAGTEPSSGGEHAPKPSGWRRFLGLFWDSVDGSPRERRYIRKLDSFMFSYICLGYFIKYLDQTNYSNAFVSGMKEDLHLYGQQRNWLNTYFNIGIIVGSIPSQLIQLEFVRPSIWIPCCEIVWSVLVISMAGCKNIESMYVLRFFIGLAEACSFPGYSALLGGWYGPNQLSKRVAIFEQTSAIASMLSGYLQAELYKGMNGKLGLAGWRWLFIFDGIISIPTAVWGLFAIPDLPHTTRAFYWSKDDRQYGVERIEKIGRRPNQKTTLRTVRRIFTSWQLWSFILPYLMVAESGSRTSYFNLYLKWAGYSVEQINVLPTAGSALSVVTALGFGMVADATGWRIGPLVVVQIITMVSNIILTVWHVPTAVLLFAYYLSYVGAAGQPIVIAWGHHLNARDPALRQLLVATGNIFTYCFSAFLPLALFPTQDAPKYKYGYQILILFGGLAIVGAILMDFLHKRYERKDESTSELVAGVRSSGIIEQ